MAESFATEILDAMGRKRFAIMLTLGMDPPIWFREGSQGFIVQRGSTGRIAESMLPG